MSTPLICSYIKEKYYVSTIHRESSASEGPKMYYETIVWQWNSESRVRGELLEQHDSGLWETQAFESHAYICLGIYQMDKEKK